MPPVKCDTSFEHVHFDDKSDDQLFCLLDITSYKGHSMNCNKCQLVTVVHNNYILRGLV